MTRQELTRQELTRQELTRQLFDSLITYCWAEACSEEEGIASYAAMTAVVKLTADEDVHEHPIDLLACGLLAVRPGTEIARSAGDNEILKLCDKILSER